MRKRNELRYSKAIWEGGFFVYMSWSSVLVGVGVVDSERADKMRQIVPK